MDWSICEALSILLDMYLGVALLERMVVLFSVFEELPYCFPKQLHCFTFLSIVHKDFNFSASSPTPTFCCCLYSSQWGDILLWFCKWGTFFSFWNTWSLIWAYLAPLVPWLTPLVFCKDSNCLSLWCWSSSVWQGPDCAGHGRPREWIKNLSSAYI